MSCIEVSILSVAGHSSKVWIFSFQITPRSPCTSRVIRSPLSVEVLAWFSKTCLCTKTFSFHMKMIYLQKNSFQKNNSFRYITVVVVALCLYVVSLWSPVEAVWYGIGRRLWTLRDKLTETFTSPRASLEEKIAT